MGSGTRAVIFDVGNVLFQWDRHAIYERLIEDDRALHTFVDEVVSLDWHAQHDLGISFAETSAELRARFPEHAALIDLYGPRFNDSLQNEVPGVAAILESLSVAGVPLFAITNFHDGFFAAFRASRPDVFDRFRDIVVSGEEKLIKPDPAIYHLALDRFGVAAEDAVFIDDSLANVAAAKALGITGLLFTDAATLRADLVKLGLPG
ncbi:MAG: HAD family phosphatase [Sphingomonas sp.]|uniref:HAD family hydrolase n=1 Tax=Sphingomonas sp. TaxID=28214 RepID=UPI003566C455